MLRKSFVFGVKLCNSVCNVIRIPKNATFNLLSMYFSCNLSRLIWLDNFYLLTTVTPMCLIVFQHERLLPYVSWLL